MFNFQYSITNNQGWYYGPNTIASIKRSLRRTLVRSVILFGIVEDVTWASAFFFRYITTLIAVPRLL
jgi:hypothetical protein